MNQTASPTERDALLEKVVVEGDLAKLSVPQRLDYYNRVCDSVGLNPLTRPFEYVRLSGRLRLYARKDATDQLRRLYGVSVTDIDVSRDSLSNLITVRATGQDKYGRRDIEVGSVHVGGLKGENLANAEMKALTKAKRRLTLSLCGLGWLDETEVETIENAEPVSFPADPAEPEPESSPETTPADTGVPAAGKGSAPVYRFMTRCQELKKELHNPGDAADHHPLCHEVLGSFKLGACNEVKPNDTATMTKVVKALQRAVVGKIARQISAREQELQLTLDQITSKRDAILSVPNGLDQNDIELLREYQATLAEK